MKEPHRPPTGRRRPLVAPPPIRSKAEALEANRVYYEFTTDRAITTDAVLHTVDIMKNIPFVVRAKTIHQLSQGEWRAGRAELSTSSFAVPSYSVRADKAYVHQQETGDPDIGTRTTFSGKDVTFRLYGLPFFYLPAVGGVVTDQGTGAAEISFASPPASAPASIRAGPAGNVRAHPARPTWT